MPRYRQSRLRPDYLPGHTDRNLERRKAEKADADRRVQALGFCPGARVRWQGRTGTLGAKGADPAWWGTHDRLLRVHLVLDASPDGVLREREAALPLCELELIG